MRRFYILTLIIVFAFTAQAVSKTTNWTGIGSGLLGGGDPNNWANTSNWDNGIPGSGDIAQIGVTTSYTNAPILGASTSIGTLNFGVFSTTGSLTIKSGVLLTVTGDITVQYRATTNTSATINITQTVVGTTGGAIKCNGSFFVGDNTQQATPFALIGLGFQVNNTNTLTVNVNLQNFTVDKDLALSSTSSAIGNIGGNNSVNVNNSVLNLNNGTLTVTGNISTVSTGGHIGASAFTYSLLGLIPLTNFPVTTPKAQLIVNPTGDVATNTATLSVGGTITIISGDAIDFYGPGAATCNTVYTGSTSASTTQTVYSTSQNGLDASPALYQNLATSGISPKSLQAGTITVNGNWTSTGAAVTANNSNTVYFQNSSTTLPQTLDDAAGVTFNNVNFQNAGTTKTISSGNFSVSGIGVLTVDSAVTFNTGSKLTLLSTAAGSATVATLKHDAKINGTVKVQRFVQGSADASKRGYRFFSSPVFTGTVGTSPAINCYDFNYLLNDAFVTGATGGGFNTAGTNPTIYLFREDITTSNAGFVAGNWKGVAKINNVNAFDIGTQKRLTKTNTADTTVNVPVGNGFLFYFRGNKTDNTTQTGSKVTSPYDYPEDVTFTQTGQLNTGNVRVRLWYNGNPSTFTYTNTSTVDNASSRGFVFVGNPYASTINFEKFNRQGTKSSIYSSGFTAGTGKIWVFNASNKQYETYMQASTISTVADTTSTLSPADAVAQGAASNFIASGQGFFIRVTATGAGLSFKETAKTNTQPVVGSVNSIMSTSPKGMLAFSSAVPSIASNPLTLLRFVMAKDSINNDEAILILNNTTPNTFNDESDAEDMYGNGALVSLSVMSSDNVATSVKRVKFPQIGAQSVRLLVDATASGTYHLKLKNVDNVPNAYNVWLIDSLMKDSLDLKHNSNYDFNIDKNNQLTFGRNRFSVVIRQNPEAMMHALSFAANKTIQGAQLTWRTENEGNSYTFLVEKSLDGKTFKQIGQVSSNSSGDYAYTDVQPGKGMNYYRIKLQDMVLNTASYTNVLSLNYADAVTTTMASNISVYPNPATKLVNIKMSAEEQNDNSYSIKISNSTGKVIKQITTSSPTLQTDVTEFLPGTYMIQVVNVSDNKLQGQSKFVKL